MYNCILYFKEIVIFMNIELLDMSRMTIVAKQFIKTGQFVSELSVSPKIESRLFRFAPRDGEAPFETESCEEWLRELSRRGADDCKLIMHDELDTFERLDRVNGIPCCIICFYGNKASSWNKLWTLNPTNQKWSVQFIEIPVDQMHDKPVFSDVSDNMATLLIRIRELARKLKLSEFSFKFSAALKALQADLVDANIIRPTNRRLFQAATEAYVFGGEGSWTDVAKFAAAGKGLSGEYELLTKELYKGIALSLMYAVNEW